MVIGSSNTDFIVKTKSIPKPGETLIGNNFMVVNGGKGANQAVAAARLGGDVVFVARVGGDMFGEKSIAAYAQEGIDTSHIGIDAETHSGVAFISIDEKAENSIVVALGANATLSPEHIDAALPQLREASYSLIQNEIPMETIEYAVAKSKECGVKVVLNPAPAAKFSDTVLRSLYLITPNETECEMITGIKIENFEDASRAADHLLNLGVENVVITMGASGSFIKNKEICELVPAKRVVAVDTTAAGDVFNGALCVALSEGKTLMEGVKFATRCSAIAVTRIGAQPSIPQRAELDCEQ